MVYKKKTPYKRKFVKKTYAKSKVSTTVKKYVKTAIKGSAEKKRYIYYNLNQSITTASLTTPTNLSITPTLSQGLRSFERIGDNVKVTKCVITGRVNFLPYSATTNPRSPVIVKMWVVKQKNTKNNSTFPSSITSDFFEINNSVTGLQGNLLDLMLPVNPRVWEVLATKQVTLGHSSIVNNAGAVDINYSTDAHFSYPFYFNLSKHIGTLKFQEAVTTATNNQMWIFFQGLYADGANTGLMVPAEYHSCIITDFTDV